MERIDERQTAAPHTVPAKHALRHLGRPSIGPASHDGHWLDSALALWMRDERSSHADEQRPHTV